MPDEIYIKDENDNLVKYVRNDIVQTDMRNMVEFHEIRIDEMTKRLNEEHRKRINAELMNGIKGKG